VKLSKGLSNGVSTIIRRYIYNMRCVAYVAVSFVTFFHVLLVLFFFYLCIYWFMFCMHLFNFVNYVFLLYVHVFLLMCMFCSGYSVSLCCYVCCLYVNVYCTTATGCQPNCN
jgi:hypothetical protein